MNQFDLLILAIYIICVTYVINEAIKSLDARFTVRFEPDDLKQQLQEQNLQDTLGVGFGLAARYTKPDELQKLPIIISNRSSRYSIYVDWDHSSFADFDGRSRRVIRLMPGLTTDLFQPQVFSVIAPGKTLKEAVTAEDTLKRESDAGAVKVGAPLVNLASLKTAMDKKEFSLRLVLRVFDPVGGGGGDRFHVLSCKFTARRLPWTDALPWKHLKT
ncbi:MULTISPECIES: hypothetical protein [Trichocoleus]|uniref:Uncharacterized protein n=1 Tax=Trichocoleus desertorum GB2-A4 TaxID=2933944 RepID=A0ABV0J253_9CYAN|nr:hypothetical protein [Trichocoleus sp. FACHB-46]MBD1860454.1 hypothetical protein [Trichocoleus sp. FACHB-46]